ncbi:PIG-L deacetylase family protein [Streptomyces sp. NPDC087300]|uniref:PIG-L deacetylase family protein n=1 Tax=Streptomyces sp. NPDC087300 TaxID=3365780 RepID=UPI00381147BE
MRVLLVSPHPDDVALSFGGWVAAHTRRLRAQGWRFDLLTVFGTTLYAPHSPHAVTKEAVSALREREDRAYARRHGLRLTSLRQEDCSCLGMDDEEELIAPEAGDPRRAAVRQLLAAALAGADLVVAPLGVGGHVDHRIVRGAVRQSLGATPCLWYEDLPYALESPVEPPAGHRPWLVDLRGHEEAKQADLALYRSQLTAADTTEVLSYRPDGASVPCERLWSPAGFPEDLAQRMALATLAAVTPDKESL